MTASSDTTIRVVSATIGRADHITVLPHLDTEMFIENPKPVVGYFDDSNLLNRLWKE